MKYLFAGALVFFSCILPLRASRVYGKVVDEKNEPVPFVSVVEESTKSATTSNIEGNYHLDLPAGTYTLVVRSIGYNTLKKSITIQPGQNLEVNMVLTEQAYSMEAIVVTGSAEDPAYGIIRKAQSKRKFYLNQVEQFSTDVYIKGVAGIFEAPEKILGVPITIDGLDSNRSGIVYLSESVSQYYFQKPKEKEVVVSSKVSGKSQGFSWNSALEFKLNFYEDLIPTPVTDRDVISPISPTAMTYYRYKLEGVFYDQGKTVYKILVTPKMTGSPLVNGIINIQDSSFRIHSMDMFLMKENGMNFLDTLFVKQIYSPVGGNDEIWMRSSQSFQFNFNVKPFGVKGKGYFLGTFSNYNLDPGFKKGFFSNEILKVDEESNKRPETYWDSIRPVPLTLEEEEDYVFKDSLEKIRETEVYQDSVDRISNKFKFINIITGYTWEKSYRGISFYVSSPLMGFLFNTVEGITLDEQFRFTKTNKKKRSRTSVGLDLRYGFSGKQFYTKGDVSHRFNATNRMFIAAEGGRFVFQYNQDNPISPTANSIYTVFFEENFMKTYEKIYGKIRWGRELFNGVNLKLSAEFARRVPLTNAENLTRMFIDWDNREFTSNDPLVDTNMLPAFTANNLFLLDATVNLKFGVKYISRPGLKINYDSKWPEIELYYAKAIGGVFESKPHFDFLRISISQEINTGILGSSEYFASFGIFLDKTNVPFTDFHHFNTTRTIFGPRNELRSFWALPYYQYSTNDFFVEAHFQHHFKGWFLGKIPGIKKLKWQEVVGFHFLYTPQLKDYYEFTVGLENIFRIIRADFVGGFVRGENPYFSGRVKLRI